MEELKYFFSYARNDSEFVLKLAKELRAVGANLWLDQLDILGGQHWDSTVEKALESCKGMIAVLSPESVASDNVMDEVSYALNEGKLVVPVLIRPCNIPYRLQRVQYIDFTADYDTGFSQLLRALGIEQPVQPLESTATQEPVVQEPSLPKQSEPTPDEQKPGLETEKAGSRSRMAKVIAAICIVTLITIISIVVFLKDRQRTDQPKRKPGNVETNSIGMKLVYIPAGEFMMGSSRSAAQLAREYETWEERFTDEFPQHQVRISEGFWMGQTEVTQGQYKSVMNAQPWSGEDSVQESANNPAVHVTWDDAAAFCRKLSQQEGKTYRLPTEAEWEYACRAGTTTEFSFGDSDSSLGDHAWFYDNASKVGQKYAHSVGQKKPNPWGLYDMHGNVWECCSDWYDEDYYSNSPSVDPKGPPLGAYRSLRGGSWGGDELNLRCSMRSYLSPDYRLHFVGFRVVRSQ